MKLTFTNFGPIEQAEITLAPLTLFCGANNTGKTYAMYAFYGLLSGRLGPIQEPDEVDAWLDRIAAEGVVTLDLVDWFTEHSEALLRRIDRRLEAGLPALFSAEPQLFQQSKLSVLLDLAARDSALLALEIGQRLEGRDGETELGFTKDSGSRQITITRAKVLPVSIAREELERLLIKLALVPWRGDHTTLLLPAERSGLNLFYPELNRSRTALFHHASKPRLNAAELIRDIVLARYPQPIADYIDFLNDMRTLRKRQSEFHDEALSLQKTVLRGKFAVDRDANVTFTPKGGDHPLSLHLSSSTTKTYFGLWFYLEHVARKGDVLMFDEPELNLHPDNQRKLARLLVRLVNLGQRVIVSTHSDYLVREINNLILLQRHFTGHEALRAEYGYEAEEGITADQIRAWHFTERGVTPMEISAEEGILATTFDDVINQLNESSYAIASQSAAHPHPVEPSHA
jgi:AAA domain, putative AbiEii toxin, Type IV TA system/AAA ATPase domain